jgi:hypothetical protein
MTGTSIVDEASLRQARLGANRPLRATDSHGPSRACSARM